MTHVYHDVFRRPRARVGLPVAIIASRRAGSRVRGDHVLSVGIRLDDVKRGACTILRDAISRQEKSTVRAG
jgi:hypothetical protein